MRPVAAVGCLSSLAAASATAAPASCHAQLSAPAPTYAGALSALQEGVINAVPGCTPQIVLSTLGDGNCLSHSCSLGVFGVHDKDGRLRWGSPRPAAGTALACQGGDRGWLRAALTEGLPGWGEGASTLATHLPACWLSGCWAVERAWRERTAGPQPLRRPGAHPLQEHHPRNHGAPGGGAAHPRAL